MKKGHKSLNNFFLKTEYIGSYLNYKKIPKHLKPEVCFIGRSNVGKSSLINKLTKKNIAKTSKTPGRTQALNLFSVSDKIYLMDLPGYGYAKLSRKIKVELFKLINEYVLKRENLKHIFLLVDGKVGLKKTDIETINFFIEKILSFSVVLTKIDKCSKNIIEKNTQLVLNIFKSYSYEDEILFSVSATKNYGITNLQKKIYEIGLK
tara:strand:- start:525 stop:1142 length:618 start_codon:yes stop_codon:yes gene_type:complete